MRTSTIARAAALVTALILAGCQDTGTGPQAPGYQIMDAAHDAAANPDFFFLPPLVPDPSANPSFDAGAFDASLTPTVEICQADEAGCLAQQTDGFPIVSGSDALEAVTIATADEQYRLNWHTDGVVLDPARTYRIRVLVAGAELGFADVDVVNSGRELKNVETGEYIALLDGRTLPVKFRIEHGAVFVIGAEGGTISAMGGKVTLVFPPDALSAPTGITVLPGAALPGDPDVVPGTVFDFGPNGTAFAEPVLMTIAYDPAQLAPGTDESALVLGHFVGGTWTEVAGSTVDLTAHTVSGPVMGFSLYAIRYPIALPPPPISTPIVFQSSRDGDGEIFAYDGTTETQLTHNTVTDGSPDRIGDRIAFDRRDGGNNDIWVMNADGTGEVNITNSALNEFGPKWSPDGCRIAFVRMMADHTYDVWVMDADGSNQVNLTADSPGNDAAPAWSPDGDKIVFNSNRTGSIEVYTMWADGSGVFQVTNDPATDDGSAEFSPNGLQIVFSKYVPGTSGDIWIVNATGTNPHAVTTSPTMDYGPAWSPDGTRIVFERWTALPSGGHTDLWLVNPDGTDLRQLIHSGTGDGGAAWQRAVPPEFAAVDRPATPSGGVWPRLGTYDSRTVLVYAQGNAIRYQYLNSVTGMYDGPPVTIGSGAWPDIDGHLVVWQQTTTTGYAIMLYDLDGGSTTTIVDRPDATLMSRPRIDGDAIVWLEDANTAMYYNLGWASGTPPVALGGPSPRATWVDVGSRYIVWAEEADGQGDIKAYDRATLVTFTVSDDPAVGEDLPRTSGDWVVWQAGSEVRLADLSASPVTPLRVGTGTQPIIDGDLVVFRQGPFRVYRISDGSTFSMSAALGGYFDDVRGNKVAYVTSSTTVHILRMRFGCVGSCTGCGTP